VIQKPIPTQMKISAPASGLVAVADGTPAMRFLLTAYRALCHRPALPSLECREAA
jgi:hypothetical protein